MLYRLISTISGCATDITPQEIEIAEQKFQNRLSEFGRISSGLDALVIPPIPVVWHVIHGSDSLTDGNVPDSQIEASIEDMNTHFACAPFLSGVLDDAY